MCGAAGEMGLGGCAQGGGLERRFGVPKAGRFPLAQRFCCGLELFDRRAAFLGEGGGEDGKAVLRKEEAVV